MYEVNRLLPRIDYRSRPGRVPLSRFGWVLSCGMCGRSGAVSWLQVCEEEGRNGEAVAELEGGRIKRQADEGGPEIELIAAAAAVKAPEEVAVHMDREAGGRPGTVRRCTAYERTGAAPLRAAACGGFPGNEFEYALHGDPGTNRRVVEQRVHEDEPPFVSFVVGRERRFCLAFCSAR
jgi:hypothetical protein